MSPLRFIWFFVLHNAGTPKLMSNIKQEENQAKLPRKPVEPDPHECCGRGCDPCIYDYYAKALARWEKRVAEIQQNSK